jgi:hypothetical protein
LSTNVHYIASHLIANTMSHGPMSEDVRRMVGDNVKRLRLAAKLTQAELADRMGSIAPM